MNKISTTTQQVKVHRTDSLLEAGLRQSWLSGEGDGVSFDLDCGAGLGSPWLLLSVTLPDGSRTYEYVDIREFAQARVDAIRAEHQEES